MFPWGNSENPLESLFKKPSFQLFDDQNPTFKQDDSPFFSNFPSPFFDELELPLYQILPQQQQQLKPVNQCVPPDQALKKETPKRKVTAKLKEKASADHPISNSHVPPPRRRRTGKKDRHSKICTAQGIRDRRMRLSLQVARKFFDLQDMLGYDKASKTIEWLFNQSKKSIKDLIDDGNNKNNINLSISDAKSESFISECEVLSGIEENSNNEMEEGVVPYGASPLFIKGSSEKPRKTACKPSMKESREKARERAKCRTREKIMIKDIEGSGRWCKSSPNRDDLQKLGSSNGPSDQESGPVNQERVSPYDAHYLYQSSDVGTIEKLLENYHCSAATVSGSIDPTNNFMGFLGNWDLLSNDRMNSSQYAVITNQQVSLAGNPNSIYSGSNPDFQLFDHQ